nr:MAG TPA: hypothetical protein [Caudoviricetes sp.]
MRSLDRLEQQKRLRRQKENLPQPDEELEEELELPRFIPLNQRKSAFDDSAGRSFGGINTAQSVFDRQAAIHTE